MKWAFLAALVLLIPLLTALLRSQPRYLIHTCFVAGVLMLVAVPKLWAAPIPWPGWPGPVKGIEVNVIDSISAALILSTRPVRIPLSVKLPFLLYFLAVIVSSFVAYQSMPAAFYVWQLIRSVALFVAIARVCGTVSGAPVALIAGLGVGLGYEAVLAAKEFVGGDPRPGGNLGHSNFLGLASDFVVFPTMALLLGTKRFLWPAAVVGAGMIIAVVGGSRATLGLFAIGLVLTLVFSLQHGTSSRKMAFGGAALLLLLCSTPVMVWALNHRSAESKESSDVERNAMKSAARMIIADHPLGVGANQYVIVANTGGYSQRAGVAWNYGSRSAPVHDTYYLVTAELGFVGLIGFLGTIVGFIALGWRTLRRRSEDETSELVPGLLATMIVVSVHVSYEWVFMNFVLHYMFALAAGLLVGVVARSRSPVRLAALAPLPAVSQGL